MTCPFLHLPMYSREDSHASEAGGSGLEMRLLTIMFLLYCI